MSKKTLLLIIFLFLVTCGLLYLALVTNPNPQPKPTVVGPTPTPISVNAHTLLSIAPASATESSKLTQYTLAVHIDTGSNLVNSVQLEIAYDPTALSNVTLAPGSFFQQPSALVNNVDSANGRISYALVEQMSLPGKSGNGTVALLSFDKQPSYTGTTTTLTFLPKTAVAADRILESVLRKTSGYTLTFTKPSTTPTQNVGTTSAQ